MDQKSDEALAFLLKRRSRPAKTLAGPYPSATDLAPILTAGLRCPDHGKLEPWRLIVLNDAALTRLSKLVGERGAALGLAPEQIEKGVAQYRDSGCAIIVVSNPIASPKVPQIEQVYSAGAVCLGLVNAALAAGWGANWLSGWMIYDDAFKAQAFALNDGDEIAGLIHIGTETNTPPERPRPDENTKVTWITE